MLLMLLIDRWNAKWWAAPCSHRIAGDRVSGE